MTAPAEHVTKVERGPRVVSRRVTVHAGAAHLFAMVADPHRHPELDGSGTVRDTPVKGPEVLTEGARFSVGMKQYGVPYSITSTVTEFDDGKVVAWRHPMGHTWRWEFEEVSPGVTEVTETFDYRRARSPRFIEIFGQPKANEAGITRTLQKLARRHPA